MTTVKLNWIKSPYSGVTIIRVADEKEEKNEHPESRYRRSNNAGTLIDDSGRRSNDAGARINDGGRRMDDAGAHRHD
jgi:hypothetical protein